MARREEFDIEKLSPEERKRLRQHMPPAYRMMADIIEHARLTKYPPVAGGEIKCPRCGYRFSLSSKAKKEEKEPLSI